MYILNIFRMVILGCNEIWEYGGNVFLQNFDSSPHSFRTQKINIDIFTVVGTSDPLLEVQAIKVECSLQNFCIWMQNKCDNSFRI